MRPGTTIALAVLLGCLFLAAVFQFFVIAR
jgi:hypothetical protein